MAFVGGFAVGDAASLKGAVASNEPASNGPASNTLSPRAPKRGSVPILVASHVCICESSMTVGSVSLTMMGATLLPAPTPYSVVAVAQYMLGPRASSNAVICVSSASPAKSTGMKMGCVSTGPPPF